MQFDMSVETFLTLSHCTLDELYQTYAPAFLAGKVRAKPEFSDSEALTLMMAQHWRDFQKGATWLRFVKNNGVILLTPGRKIRKNRIRRSGTRSAPNAAPD